VHQHEEPKHAGSLLSPISVSPNESRDSNYTQAYQFRIYGSLSKLTQCALLLSSLRQDRLCDPSTLTPNRHRPQPEDDHSAETNVKAKHAWSCTSLHNTPSHGLALNTESFNIVTDNLTQHCLTIYFILRPFLSN
jgi:hypothetical protein